MSEEKRPDKNIIQKRLNKSVIQKILVIALVVLCLVIIWNMNQSLDKMQQELSMLRHEINGLRSSISNEIGNISYNIESSLKKENSIIADYSYQVQADKINRKEKTIPLSLMVRPKEHREGVKTTFILETQDGKIITAPGKEGEGSTYTASIVVPLSMSDCIKLSVSFDDGAVQRSEKLEDIYQFFDSYIMKVDSTALLSISGLSDPKHKLRLDGTIETSITESADGSNYPVGGEVQIFINESVIKKLPIPVAQAAASDYGNGAPAPEASAPIGGSCTTYYTQLNETVTLESNDALKINVIVKDNLGFKYKQTVYSQQIDKDGNFIPANYSPEVIIE